MSASPDPATELAHLALALSATARRAEWRGAHRVLRAQETAPEGAKSALAAHEAGALEQDAPGFAPDEAKPRGPGPIHNPPPTQGQTEPAARRFPPSQEIVPAAAGGTAARLPAELEPSPEEIHGDGVSAPAVEAEESLGAGRSNEEIASGCADLAGLRSAVAGCRACPLHRTRTQTVFQDGSSKARVLFIGEAPGADEDAQGVPFVGRAGRLLTDIIEKGMGLRREEVAIANVLKCRPPGNRDPEPEEKKRCTPFLDRQIELIDPEVLIPLGRHAAQHVLDSPLSMGRLRGRVHELGGRKVVPTYHPAYLLRTPSAKKDCWQDIQVAMRVLGIEPPPRR